jgi:outer membrane immunogenic protein
VSEHKRAFLDQTGDVMKNMKFASVVLLAAATSITALLDTTAYAADLPQRPTYKQPVIVAPIYNWTGCYVGGNIGGLWGRADISAAGGQVSGTNSGFVGGGQIGCDYQMGTWVVGIRNMFDGTSLTNSETFGPPAAGFTSSGNMHWFDTLTARGGYLVQPNWLLYAQGGIAWANRSQTVTNPLGGGGEISNNTTGWTIGGGVEWMFEPHWSAFLEYNYMNFGTTSGTVSGPPATLCATGCSASVKADASVVLVGVNYKF